MATLSLRDQIIEEVGRLTPEQQRKVLEFARGLIEQGRLLEGESGESLLQYLDSMDAFDPDDLQRMAKAIEEDCEQINPNDW